MNLKKLFLIIIFSSALLIRLYNFENRLTFGSEQARSLVVSGRMLQKFSLLGQEYFRVTTSGHKLFSGALFNYSLVPLQILFKFDPLPITTYFVLLNTVIGLILYILVKKVFDYNTAIFSVFLFLFSAHMIYHSMFIWILNYYPLIGLLTLYFLYLFKKNPSAKNTLSLGLISGVAINFHYLFIPFALAILGYVIWRVERNLKNVSIYLTGLLIGNFPMVAFDLRHNFYHLRTLIQYTKDVVSGLVEGELTYYHFLHLWPLMAIGGGILLNKLWKIKKIFSSLILLTYLYFNLSSDLVNFSKPTGMPEGLLYKDVFLASRVIAGDASTNFNVSALLDFDKRGYVLRYPVEFLYGKKPQEDEEYQNSDVLYVLADTNYNFERSDVWEINVFSPYDIKKLSDVGQGYSVFKITRIQK